MSRKMTGFFHLLPKEDRFMYVKKKTSSFTTGDRGFAECLLHTAKPDKRQRAHGIQMSAKSSFAVCLLSGTRQRICRVFKWHSANNFGINKKTTTSVAAIATASSPRPPPAVAAGRARTPPHRRIWRGGPGRPPCRCT